MVTAGFVLYFGDMLGCTIAKVGMIYIFLEPKLLLIFLMIIRDCLEQILGAFSSSDLVSVQYMMNRSEISPIIQVCILFDRSWFTLFWSHVFVFC